MLFIKPSRGIILALSLFYLGLTTPTMAQERILRTITVTGEGIERIPTTIAQVQLGVEITGPNANEVQQEVAKRTSSLVELLRSRQVQQLQTTGVQLQPTFDYSNNQRRLIGYTGTNLVSFRFPIEQIGGLLDDAVKTGATRIDNINLTATDAAIKEARNQALQEATLDAQQQAGVVLKTLNLNPKEVVSISINGANIPVPTMVSSDQFALRAAPATPVIGGEQTVRASVTLQITY